MSAARAVACSNIALAKYWGKADVRENLPAVPSLSLTLDALRTTTTVRFDPTLQEDHALLDGRAASARERGRIVALLDRVRALSGLAARARVESANDFPTAAGLASSASGFAALALAATRAARLRSPIEEISALAREASASAARSLYGGWVALPAGARHAEPVAPPDHLPVELIVCVTESGPKPIGSTEAMLLTADTSPYYAAWLAEAPVLYEQARAALLARDLDALGRAAEASALAMHASMLAARPPVVYFAPGTLSVMRRVQVLRERHLRAFYTMDAGPHVKVLVDAAQAAEVASALAEVPGVARTVRCRPGPSASVEELPE